MKIRPLTSDPRDMQGVLDLARQFHAESPHYSPIEFQPDVVAAEIVRTLTMPAYGSFVAEAEDGQIVGVIAGFDACMLFTRALRITDTMFYVAPKARRTGAGQALLEAFEGLGRERGAFESQMVVTSKIGEDKVRRTYEAAGYEVVGFVVRKSL